MAFVSGKNQKVTFGEGLVAGIGDWSLSNTAPELVEATGFGDDVKRWVDAGIADAGTVSFKGFYDPTDIGGQKKIMELLNSGKGTAELFFYENESAYWKVGSGGEIFITKASLDAGKAKLMEIAFDGKVSGAKMVRTEVQSK